jgi:hypothetical protein
VLSGRFFAEWLLARGLVRTDQQVLLAMQTPESRATLPFIFSSHQAPASTIPGSDGFMGEGLTREQNAATRWPDGRVFVPYVEIQSFFQSNGWMYLGNLLLRSGTTRTNDTNENDHS